MRFSLLASALLATTAVAQTPNLFDQWGCSNYTSRGLLGVNPGDNLVAVPSTVWQGIAQDAAGTGTRLNGFVYVMQDQNAATTQQYSLIVRGDASGQPDNTAAGLLLQTTLLTSPSGTGTLAWIFTVDLTTPSTVVPTCSTWYTGTNDSGAPSWTSDGISWHISTQALLGGTAAGNPSPAAVQADVHRNWGIINGTGGTVGQPGGFRTVRYGVRVTQPILHIGGTDPTLIGVTTNCVNAILNGAGNPTCYNTGGQFPGATSGRSDGLDCRVRAVQNANGVFATFLSTRLGCPGVALAPLFTGQLFLAPGTLIQVASGGLNAAGLGTATMLPPGVAGLSFTRGPLDFQAFTIGSTFALPGAMTNLATVQYK